MLVEEKEIDFLNYTNKIEREADVVRDLAFEEMEEMCYRIVIKDLKTGKKVLNLVTDQITIEQKFSMETGCETLEVVILLSDEYVEENGDKEFMGEE